VFPHVVLDRQKAERRLPSSDRRPTALFVGRLLAWKGGALALRALALLDGWELIVCGSGRDKRRLERLATKLRVELMRDSDVLLFPSLHDEGGFVIAEAMAAGLSVVCLKRGGPPTIWGAGIVPSRVSRTVEDLARAVLDSDESSVPPFPDIDSSADRLRALLVARLPFLDVKTPRYSEAPPASLPAATDARSITRESGSWSSA
jgi:glycosyltransferase involved in cell wall biosynthesis